MRLSWDSAAKNSFPGGGGGGGGGGTHLKKKDEVELVRVFLVHS